MTPQPFGGQGSLIVFPLARGIIPAIHHFLVFGFFVLSSLSSAALHKNGMARGGAEATSPSLEIRSTFSFVVLWFGPGRFRFPEFQLFASCLGFTSFIDSCVFFPLTSSSSLPPLLLLPPFHLYRPVLISTSVLPCYFRPPLLFRAVPAFYVALPVSFSLTSSLSVHFNCCCLRPFRPLDSAYAVDPKLHNLPAWLFWFS